MIVVQKDSHCTVIVQFSPVMNLSGQAASSMSAPLKKRRPDRMLEHCAQALTSCTPQAAAYAACIHSALPDVSASTGPPFDMSAHAVYDHMYDLCVRQYTLAKALKSAVSAHSHAAMPMRSRMLYQGCALVLLYHTVLCIASCSLARHKPRCAGAQRGV